MRYRVLGITWALLFVVMVGAVQTARAETWRLAVIEDWPPYADRSLGDNSLAIKALKEVLDHMDITLDVVYMPWARAKHAVMTDQRYVGFYCAWPGDIEENMIRSQPLLYSPIAIVSHIQKTYGWKDRAAFKDLRVVKVRHYEYPKFFQDLPRAMYVSNPSALLKAVASKRADFGIIDRNVMAHLLAHDESLASYKFRLHLDDEDVVTMPLIIGFADTPLNRRRNARLTGAIEQLNRKATGRLGE